MKLRQCPGMLICLPQQSRLRLLPIQLMQQPPLRKTPFWTTNATQKLTKIWFLTNTGMLGKPTQVCNVPAPMWPASALLVVARERHQSCTQLAAAASTLRQAHGYLPGSYPREPVGQVVPSRWADICRHVPIDAARACVCNNNNNEC